MCIVAFDPHHGSDTDPQRARIQGTELNFRSEFWVVITSTSCMGWELSLSAYQDLGTGLSDLSLHHIHFSQLPHKEQIVFLQVTDQEARFREVK